MRTFKFLLSVALLASGPLRAAEFNVEQFAADAKAAQAAQFKDPGSAQFRGTYVIRWDDKGREIYTLCGEVNAKNSFGAYVGFAPFYVDRLPSGQLSPSSALESAASSGLTARFAADLCAGKLRPVERIN